MGIRSLLVALTVLLVAVWPASAAAFVPYPGTSTGIDISWPDTNCRSTDRGSFTIIGVTGGLDFRPNPCLLSEVQRSGTAYSLYLNTGYPGTTYKRQFPTYPQSCTAQDGACLAYNYGYAAASYGLLYSARLNIHTTIWWLDVETVNSWTDSPQQNVAVLKGMIAALQDHTFLPAIGFYAYPGQWKLLTGSWHNGLPAWVATGSSSRHAAIAACKQPSFTGGPVVLTQYISHVDEDYACPAPD